MHAPAIQGGSCGEEGAGRGGRGEKGRGWHDTAAAGARAAAAGGTRHCGAGASAARPPAPTGSQTPARCCCGCSRPRGRAARTRLHAGPGVEHPGRHRDHDGVVAHGPEVVPPAGTDQRTEASIQLEMCSACCGPRPRSSLTCGGRVQPGAVPGTSASSSPNASHRNRLGAPHPQPHNPHSTAPHLMRDRVRCARSKASSRSSRSLRISTTSAASIATSADRRAMHVLLE